MAKLVLRWTLGLILVFSFLTMATPVAAFEAKTGNSVTIPADVVVEGDLYLAGGNIVVNGTVNGDVFGFGQTIIINGTVNGGLSVAGQSINVNGKIGRGARLAGQTISVSGSIAGDLVAAGQSLDVSSTAKVGGDLIVAAGTASINGQVAGSVKGAAGEVTLAGSVGKNVELKVEKLDITTTAVVQGNVIYVSKSEAAVHPAARIKGSVTRNLPEVKEREKGFFAALAGMMIFKILGFVMALVTGIVLIIIASRRMGSMSDNLRSHPWLNLGWGAALLVATPIAAIIVCFTVIGLPLGLIALVLWGIAIYLCQIPVALAIGRLIIKHPLGMESRGFLIGALALGLAILAVLRIIPFLGFFVSLLTVLFGMGLLVTYFTVEPE